jgi:hypothetical protein
MVGDTRAAEIDLVEIGDQRGAAKQTAFHISTA